jgi:hypothetical protein
MLDETDNLLRDIGAELVFGLLRPLVLTWSGWNRTSSISSASMTTPPTRSA